MANSLSANLLLDTFSERMETTLGPVLAPLSAFAKDFSDAGIDAVMQTKSDGITANNVSATTIRSGWLLPSASLRQAPNSAPP